MRWDTIVGSYTCPNPEELRKRFGKPGALSYQLQINSLQVPQSPSFIFHVFVRNPVWLQSGFMRLETRILENFLLSKLEIQEVLTMAE